MEAVDPFLCFEVSSIKSGSRKGVRPQMSDPSSFFGTTLVGKGMIRAASWIRALASIIRQRNAVRPVTSMVRVVFLATSLIANLCLLGSLRPGDAARPSRS